MKTMPSYLEKENKKYAYNKIQTLNIMSTNTIENIMCQNF